MMGMFFIAPKVKAVEQSICNRLCYSCNFNLCMKNAENDNNINSYVVTLTNEDPKNDIHFHYSCLHHYLIINNTEIDIIPICDEAITRILNIDSKPNALIGTDFYI
jgi:hypothetical protein